MNLKLHCECDDLNCERTYGEEFFDEFMSLRNKHFLNHSFFILDKNCLGGFKYRVVEESEHFKLVEEL